MPPENSAIVRRSLVPIRCAWRCLALAVLWIFLLGSPAAALELRIEADQQYDYAAGLMQAGHYRDAIVEWRRFLHFFPGDSRVAVARFEMAKAHFNLGQYEPAADLFAALAAGAQRDENLSKQAYWMWIRALRRQGDEEASQRVLRQLAASAPDADMRSRARWQLGWSLFEQRQAAAARNQLQSIDQPFFDRWQVDLLLGQLDAIEAMPKKNPTMAAMLSVVPGGGQLYCQRPQDAWIAFSVNAVLIAATIEAFDRDLPVIGTVLGGATLGVYSANIYNAMSSADKFNRRARSQRLQRLKEKQPPELTLSAIPRADGLALVLRATF